MRALNLVLAAAVSLGLGACSNVRTVNGVDIESRHFCERRTERCVLLAGAAIVAAGAVAGLAIGFADRGSSSSAATTTATVPVATTTTTTTTTPVTTPVTTTTLP